MNYEHSDKILKVSLSFHSKTNGCSREKKDSNSCIHGRSCTLLSVVSPRSIIISFHVVASGFVLFWFFLRENTLFREDAHTKV